MKKNYIAIILMLLMAAVFISSAAAQEEFHSEFGYLPPEIADGSGMAAEKLDGLVVRLDQSALPPSHRLRYVYEWMMQKYQYFPEDSFASDLGDDLEAVSFCVLEMMQQGSSGDAGFALLSHYLLDRMGFPTVIIRGTLTLPDGSKLDHEWNYVFYESKWYHFDPLGESLNASLNGFMNVEKDLTNGALSWDKDAVPESPEYPVRAFGCACSF